MAVPADPPCDSRSRTAAAQLRDLIATARIDLILAERTVASRVLTSPELVPQLRALPWVTVDGDPGGNLTVQPESGPEPEDIAVLYPIGGSCASDGVLISHGDLLCDLAESATLELHNARSVSVSWLPATHRTGLVDGILQPVFSGSPGWLMSPEAFLERPFRWLHAISTLHATHSTAPGFAFDLCVRRVSGLERAGLDLTSWRTASSGRTPIPASTMDAFERAFGPAGFRPTAFRPALQQPAPSALQAKPRKVKASCGRSDRTTRW
jgi:acyl-CoA synthetase (AMP-forming)/AMP-acid ligase II